MRMKKLCVSNPVNPSSHDHSPSQKCMKNETPDRLSPVNPQNHERQNYCCKPLSFGVVCCSNRKLEHLAFLTPVICTGMLKNPVTEFFSFVIANANVPFI